MLVIVNKMHFQDIFTIFKEMIKPTGKDWQKTRLLSGDFFFERCFCFLLIWNDALFMFLHCLNRLPVPFW